MFTQPAIAGGFLPDGSTDLTYSALTFGCKALKQAADGDWLVTLDDDKLRANGTGAGIQNCVVVPGCGNDVSGATLIGVVVTAASLNTFRLKAFTTASAAIDAGISFAVYALPAQL